MKRSKSRSRKDGNKVVVATVTTSLARFREEVGPDFLSLSLASVTLGDAGQATSSTTATSNDGGAFADTSVVSITTSAAEAVPVRAPARKTVKGARAGQELAGATPLGKASQPSRPRSKCKSTSNDVVSTSVTSANAAAPAVAVERVDAAAPIAAEPIHAMPPRASLPPRAAAHVPPAAVPRRVVEDDDAPPPPPPPAWVRDEMLPLLGLRDDLPLHFICRKRVEVSDLSMQQNRFLIPTDAVIRHLRLLLSDEERQAANLVEEERRKKPPKQQPEQPDGKKPRETAQKDPGLVVYVVVNRAVPVDVMVMEMTRRDSNSHTIIRQREHTRFADRGVQVMDDVAVWAFRREPNGTLHFVIANTAYEQHLPDALQQQQVNGLPQLQL